MTQGWVMVCVEKADIQRAQDPHLRVENLILFPGSSSRIYPPELRLRGQELYGRMGCCGVTDKVSRRLKELKFTFTPPPPMLKGSRSQTLGQLGA